jgi:Protein of unknown function (DUF4242)
MTEPRLARYLVEWYQPDVTRGAVDDVVARLELAASELREEGTPVHLLVALSVPTDEVFYCLYAAHSEEVVRAACTRAGIPVERLSADVDARFDRELCTPSPPSS